MSSQAKPQQWIIDQALAGEVVASIGQVEPATVKALNRLVKAGRLARCKGSWCSLLLTSHHTLWVAPFAAVPVGQVQRIVEMTDAFVLANRCYRALAYLARRAERRRAAIEAAAAECVAGFDALLAEAA